MKIKSVGFLATGDEICNGDVLNTNSQTLAREITELGLSCGNHMMVTDEQSDIEQALEHLLFNHDFIIVTGGLGPTSDDRTRYAVASVVAQELVFDDTSWDQIVTLISALNLKVHESNRQQALFPANATIMPNPHGSAPGCYVEYHGKIIFLLPGPPRECLPMFENFVKPQLQQHVVQQNIIRKKWRLFGASEGEIAAAIDEALRAFPCTTGYRIDYPYLEFKIHSEIDDSFDDMMLTINNLITPYLLSHEHTPSSEVFIQQIIANKQKFIIDDQATGGLLQATIHTPKTHPYLSFKSIDTKLDANCIYLSVKGLAEYWQNQKEPGDTQLIIETTGAKKFHLEETIPYRHFRILGYAVEYISHQMVQLLKS
jgi:nicotinamide-nucleotide amidase